MIRIRVSLMSLCTSRNLFIKTVQHTNGGRPFQTCILFRSTEKDRVKETARKHMRMHAEEKQKLDSAAWVMLLFPVTALVLGTWQVKRKMWKVDLIKTLSERVNSSPRNLPHDLSELQELEYYPVRVRGVFDHSKEIFMGPKTLLQGGDVASEGGLMSMSSSRNVGFLVITPFHLADRDLTILVNRGWVPKSMRNPRLRQDGQIEGEVELVGLIRLNEKRPPLSPKDSSSDSFTYRDINKMSEITGADPVYLDAVLDSTVPGGPIAGQTKVVLRDEHLSYIFTWYSIGIATAIMWYRTYIRKAVTRI